MTAGETITKILSEQVKGYKTLVDLLQKERTCLLDLNAQGVEELSKEKDTLIMRLRLLEEERIRLVRKHFNGDVSLQKLWEQTRDDTLMEMRSKLLSLVQSIEELNEFNRLLIGRSLNYIKTTADFFGLSGLNKGRGAYVSREI
jgi:flagellar biosynthesis/type III secretory pathway chaperone